MCETTNKNNIHPSWAGNARTVPPNWGLFLKMKRFNQGTDLGQKIIECSLKKFGACRSVVVDKNGDTIIGDKVLQKAKELGIPVLEIETDGSVLVVVKRTDLDANSKKAKEIGFVDNLSSEKGLKWNNDYILETMNTEWGFDPRNYGVEMSLEKEFNIEDFFKEIKDKPVKQEQVTITQATLFDEM